MNSTSKKSPRFPGKNLALKYMQSDATGVRVISGTEDDVYKKLEKHGLIDEYGIATNYAYDIVCRRIR